MYRESGMRLRRKKRGEERRRGAKTIVTVLLTKVSVIVTYSFEPRLVRSRPGGNPGSRGRVRCPRAALQPAPGRHSGINPSALRPGRDCVRWTGTGRGG